MGEAVALEDLARYLPALRPKSISKKSEWRAVEKPSLNEWLAEEKDSKDPSTKDQARVREIIAQSAFTPPVESFLYFGRPGEFDTRDYLQEGIAEADIPELIRMATHRELNRAPYPSSLVWAPVHAWRALGQLRATAAIEPLLTLLKYIDEDQDDWIGEDFPRVFSQLGPDALEPLAAYLGDASHPLWARVAAEESIYNIRHNFPETRAASIALLTRTLERYAENDPILNADIIYGLTRFRARETLPSIENKKSRKSLKRKGPQKNKLPRAWICNPRCSGAGLQIQRAQSGGYTFTNPKDKSSPTARTNRTARASILL